MDAADLLKIEKIAPKGRIQDKEYNPNLKIVESIVHDWQNEIPILIQQITDTTRFQESPVDYWQDCRVGDVALLVILDLVTDDVWSKSSIAPLSWDSLLINFKDDGKGLFSRYQKLLKKEGRIVLQRRIKAIWDKHKNEVYWDSKSNCLKRLLVKN